MVLKVSIGRLFFSVSGTSLQEIRARKWIFVAILTHIS